MIEVDIDQPFAAARITANDTVAQQGSYSTWTTPNTYMPVRT